MELSEKRLKTIGHAIAVERERQGISQIKLATMLGYTNHAYLSRVECGKQMPSMEMIFELADILDVQVNYFFTDI